MLKKGNYILYSLAIADTVLRYRPKGKSKPAKKRQRRARKAAKNEA